MEPLKILIEADAAGLKAQFTNIARQIESLVGQMNKQSVDWEKILAGAISPALVGAIAGMFAEAITSALSFQSAVTTANATSSQAFLDNAAAAKEASMSIASTTSVSASDIYTALGTSTAALGDYNTALAMVTKAAEISTATHIPFAQLIEQFTPALHEWGTAAGDVASTMTTLFGLAASGNVPLGDLLETMSKTGAILKPMGASLLDTAAATEAYGKKVVIAGGSAKDATTVIETLVSKMTDAATAAQLAGIGLGSLATDKTLINAKGLAGALDVMDTSIKNSGPNSKILVDGIFGPEVGTHVSEVAKQTGLIYTNLKDMLGPAGTLGNSLISTLDITSQLSVKWNAFKTTLLGMGGSLLPFVQAVATLGLNVVEGLLGPLELAMQLAQNTGSLIALMSGNSTGAVEANTAKLNSIMDKYYADKKAGNKDAMAIDLQNAKVQMNAGAPAVAQLTALLGATTPVGGVINNNITNYNVSSNAITDKTGIMSAGQNAKDVLATQGYLK